jgi:hypothetical protein
MGTFRSKSSQDTIVSFQKIEAKEKKESVASFSLAF